MFASGGAMAKLETLYVLGSPGNTATVWRECARQRGPAGESGGEGGHTPIADIAGREVEISDFCEMGIGGR
eukprot:2517770-Prymnesium_polylepis.1